MRDAQQVRGGGLERQAGDMITDDLIASRHKGRSGLADWYLAVFEAQGAEGLTTAELAALLGMTVANVYYWKRRLREQGPGATGPDPQGATGAGLVEVRVATRTSRSGASPPGAVLELRLAGSRSVVVPSGFDPVDLRALIGALETC